MEQRDTIVILDFGSQYSQLITRRVREAQVYCEMLPHDIAPATLEKLNPRGYILSGGPASVYAPHAPTIPRFVLESGRPILGICYGMQLLAHQLGGTVAGSDKREYGFAQLHPAEDSDLFTGLPPDPQVWMSHGDRITRLPPGFESVATTDNSPVAAMGDPQRKLYGLQFHPEVVHTPDGPQIIRNFLFRVCGCQGTWTPGSFVEERIVAIREEAGDRRILCALSGGVDSAVAATLAAKAVGHQLTCVFVDHGMLRQGEAERSLRLFSQHIDAEVIAVDASERFLRRLRGIVAPEEKRRIIGTEFIRVFEETAKSLGDFHFLLQGTLYPDVIESAGPQTAATAARIKTHHNVGGLPADMKFKLIEPLRYLFKDEVRAVGKALGLPDKMVYRQPYPGPGLAVRCIGEITPERLAPLRAADAIVREEIESAGLGRDVWQYFAVLTPVKSVGVMGDGRTYADLVAVRAITSEDGMTADWARLPHDLLARISGRIVNEVAGVNRVVYDISSKPPATIEWE